MARALGSAPPVRLHVESDASGATVWIGLDSAAALELPALLDTLSRGLSRLGVRLRSVVCNGVSYFDNDVGPTTMRHANTHSPNSPTNIDLIVEKET